MLAAGASAEADLRGRRSGPGRGRLPARRLPARIGRDPALRPGSRAEPWPRSHRPIPAGRPRLARPDGGRHRPAVPPPLPPHGRGARGRRDALRRPAALGHGANRAGDATTPGEPEPRVVQIAGGDPAMMADAARRNVDAGAQIIDINMGCPAKKVCNKDAGFGAVARRGAGRGDPRGDRAGRRRAGDAQDPHRLGRRDQRNARHHRAASPRTRASRRWRCTAARAPVASTARPSTRRSLRSSRPCASRCSPTATSTRRRKAVRVLRATGADGVMIGRAAQGRPWIFREIDALLAGRKRCRRPPSGGSA